MKKIALLLCMGVCSVVFATNIVWHKYYVSICEINHNAAAETLEISIQLFTDDLEAAIMHNIQEYQRLGGNNEFDFADEVLFDYLKEHFEINSDKKHLTLQWVGRESDPTGQTWCYLEVQNVRPFKRIYIKNTILTDLFKEQTNWIHLQTNKKRQSIAFSKDKPDGVFQNE